MKKASQVIQLLVSSLPSEGDKAPWQLKMVLSAFQSQIPNWIALIEKDDSLSDMLDKQFGGLASSILKVYQPE